MTINIQSVNRITDKHINTIYNGKKLIINEKNSPLQIRVGAKGNKYYFHGKVNNKSITKMIDNCANINLYKAYEVVDEIKSKKVPTNSKHVKTLLDVIYGDPNLISIKNISELKEKLPHGCYLFAKKDLSRFNNIRSDMNALLSFYSDKSGILSALDTTDIINSAEKLHFEQGRTPGGVNKTFDQWKYLFNWLKKRRIIDVNLLADTELSFSKPIPIEVDKTLMDKEIKVIFQRFPWEIKPPYGYLAPLGLLLCRRNSTIVKFKKSDINWEESFIQSNRDIEKKGKTAKNLSKVHLEVMMSDYAKELIKSLIKLFPDSEWLFPNPDDPKKHIEVGPNQNTKQLIDKPRKILEVYTKPLEGILSEPVEIIPFTNDRLRSTYNTKLHLIDDNTRIIEFICGLTSNRSISDIHYNRKSYRAEKLKYLNILADVYTGKVKIDDTFDKEPTTFARTGTEYDYMINKHKLNLLRQQEYQLHSINKYRESLGKRSKLPFKNDFYTEGFNFFNKVMDFEIYKIKKDLLDAKKMLTPELEEFIYSWDYYIKINNLENIINVSGKEYLDVFNDIYNKYKKENSNNFSKQDPKKLKKISDVLFLQDLKDNFDDYENITVIRLGKDQDMMDVFGTRFLEEENQEKIKVWKKTISDTYKKINQEFKEITAGSGEDLRRDYIKYLKNNYKKAQLRPLWYGLKLVYHDIKYDEKLKRSVVTATSRNDIPEHYYMRKINNIIFSGTK